MIKSYTHIGRASNFISFNLIEHNPKSVHNLSYRARLDGPSEVHRDKQKIWFSSYRGFYRLDGASRVHPERHEWWTGNLNKTEKFMEWCQNHDIDFDDIPEDMWMPLAFELI